MRATNYKMFQSNKVWFLAFAIEKLGGSNTSDPSRPGVFG